ncbi:MAG: hypothetical protein ABI771_03195 [Betaproteobacteria bacterium]
MNERDLIIGMLAQLGRRIWTARALRDAAFCACVLLFCLLCLQLVLPALTLSMPAAASPVRGAAFLAMAVALLEFARQNAHRISAREAAAQADGRGQLNDELKSAYYFLQAGPASPVEALQIRRAALTVAQLDAAALVPQTVPGSAWAALLIATLLAVTMAIAPQLSRARDPGAGITPVAHDEREDLRALLQAAPKSAEIEKLDRALRELQKSGGSAADKMRAVAEARDAIDQANMEAAAAREGLAQLGESLKADPKFEAVARAMSEGRVDDAQALLRDLRSGAAPQPQVSEAERKPGEPPEGAAPADATGRDLASKTAALNQEAINRVTQALEAAQERIEVQNRVNAVRRRMDAGLAVTSQRSQLTASQFDNRVTAANPTPAPETGNVQMRGGTLFRQAAVAKENNEESHDGSQTGDASGDSVAEPLEGVATRRLDAQLKLETILQKHDDTDEPDGKGDAGWFYSPSREQKSVLQTEAVRARGNYDRDVAAEHDRVPVRQRVAVKNYFLNLHESEKK